MSGAGAVPRHYLSFTCRNRPAHPFKADEHGIPRDTAPRVEVELVPTIYLNSTNYYLAAMAHAELCQACFDAQRPAMDGEPTLVEAVRLERQRCANLVEEAFNGDVPFFPRNWDHPQVDVPDLFEFCKRLAARILSGE